MLKKRLSDIVLSGHVLQPKSHMVSEAIFAQLKSLGMFEEACNHFSSH